MKKTCLLIIVVALIFTQSGFSQDMVGVEELLSKAEKALGENDKNKASFYLARYVGVSLGNDLQVDINRTNKVYSGMELKPTAFLSALYNEGFIEWYVLSTYYMWGVPKQRVVEDELMVQLVNANNGDYFVEVVGYPVMEAWSVIGGGKKIQDVVLHLVDSKRKPYIVSGRMEERELAKKFDIYEIDTGDLYIHSFYRPLILDIDGDGKIEICVRYSVARADGFYQKLDIFKIKDDKSLKLVKSFAGEPDGVAMVTKEKEILVAKKYPGKDGLGLLEWDRTKFEYYKFDNGKFVKTKERDEPNILMSEEFEKYFYK